MEITFNRVRELFDYCNGNLIRKKNKTRKDLIGKVAGHIDNRGYITIRIDNKKYYAHRLVWFWHHGYFPENEIDHINQNKTDNKIDNLREVVRSCNVINRPNLNTNTSGVKGVSWNKIREKWRARISVNKKEYSLGSFDDFNDAVAARLKGEKKFGWFNCIEHSPASKYILSNEVL